MEYEIIIGLEVHVQLKTDSKMFCSCRNKFGAEPNTLTCPICLGMPGVLPVINKKAFDYAIKAALALNCQIADVTKFDRKNYFYPDLPKNYQISQYDIPFSSNGHLDIKLTTQDAQHTTKRIGITRVHLEEDSGKLLHPEEINYSLVDLNRAGVPLLEIVSEPEINSPEEAYYYLGALKEIMQYLDVSDCDMEKGFLRCDANLSIRPKGAKELGTKTEIKNLNSFRFVKDALIFEAKRQKSILEKGCRITQETRLWDDVKQETKPMRSKEEAHDYRYFPEPDLMPIVINNKVIEEIKNTIPELPEARRQRFIKTYGISEYEAEVFTRDKTISEYVEVQKIISNKTARNLITGQVLQILNDKKIEFTEFSQKVNPANLLGLARELENKRIVSTATITVLSLMTDTGKTAGEIIKEQGLEQVSDEKSIEPIVREVINNNAKIVADYKGGKDAALQALIGLVMRASKGKSNPQIVRQILVNLLK